ncbi:MAG: 50S ribosomal protein L23 [Planctomycetota bacterium]
MSRLDAIYVIRRPLLTEKSTQAMNEHGQYAFEVDRRATKDDVKAAVEEMYSVRVEAVKTQLRKGKRRRLKYGWIVEKPSKKAIVRLHPDDAIELF